MPGNFIHINTGLTLETSSQIGFNWKIGVLLFVLSISVLIPLFKNNKEEKNE